MLCGWCVVVDVFVVEWQLIGKPDLSCLGKRPIYLEWVTLNGENEDFESELNIILKDRGIPLDAPLYFLCRSGGRSKLAARVAAELGYKSCFNLEEGFDGELDEYEHRNTINGWKVAGLPWTQA